MPCSEHERGPRPRLRSDEHDVAGAEYPSVQALVALARVLHVTTDELLGLKPPARVPRAGRCYREDAALLRRLRLVSQLPERDNRAVLWLIDTATLAKEARRSA